MGRNDKDRATRIADEKFLAEVEELLQLVREARSLIGQIHSDLRAQGLAPPDVSSGTGPPTLFKH
jgi:hypothetical protein